jgi:hypothetical protein
MAAERRDGCNTNHIAMDRHITLAGGVGVGGILQFEDGAIPSAQND